MIVSRQQHHDQPNEVRLFLTGSQLVEASDQLVGPDASLADLDDRGQRNLIKALARHSLNEVQRHLVDLNEQTRLDSDNLGLDLVERFAPDTDPILFDPDYVPV